LASSLVLDPHVAAEYLSFFHELFGTTNSTTDVARAIARVSRKVSVVMLLTQKSKRIEDLHILACFFRFMLVLTAQKEYHDEALIVADCEQTDATSTRHAFVNNLVACWANLVSNACSGYTEESLVS